VQLPECLDREVKLLCLEAEADELWSFVGYKDNQQWVWIAIDAETRQVIAFHVGDRSRRSARRLWGNIPAVYRRQASFDTDGWGAYTGVIPAARHHVCDQGASCTGIIERFNCSLRQRVSRLVQKALSFSKSLRNHKGAIKHFICQYNLEVMGLA
jgi:insertion element IS1 protein InsB